MDLADIINATPSGIIYSKLAEGDLIKDIIISNHKSDVVIYTKAKALRIPVNALPYLKRSTMGNQTIKSKYEVDGTKHNSLYDAKVIRAIYNKLHKY